MCEYFRQIEIYDSRGTIAISFSLKFKHDNFSNMDADYAKERHMILVLLLLYRAPIFITNFYF